MKHPVVFLVQVFAWLMLFGLIAVTWAGVTYPNGRAKAYSSEFSNIEPVRIHIVLKLSSPKVWNPSSSQLYQS